MLLVAFCLPYKGDIGGYEVKGYLLTDPSTKHTLMIETGYNAQQMLSTIKERELTLIGVGLTYGHANHVGGLDTILAEWPVPVYLGSWDFDLLPWKPDLASLKIPTNHQMIALGERTVECLATPGHTPGGFCYLTKERVFFPDHGPSITMAEEQTHNPFA